MNLFSKNHETIFRTTLKDVYLLRLEVYERLTTLESSGLDSFEPEILQLNFLFEVLDAWLNSQEQNPMQRLNEAVFADACL